MTTADQKIARAAKILSMRPADIAGADDTPAGFVITTRDGARYVDVPADQPDGDGKTGLMFLTKPNPDRTYAFPVYTSHEADGVVVEASPAVVGETKATPAPSEPPGDRQVVGTPPPRAGRGSGEKAWRKFCDANGVDHAACKTRDEVIALCEAQGLIGREATDA